MTTDDTGHLDGNLDRRPPAPGPDILRLKAVIRADGFDTPFVIHGVQHIIDPTIPLARWAGECRQSRVAIIGRDPAESGFAGQHRSAQDTADGSMR